MKKINFLLSFAVLALVPFASEASTKVTVKGKEARDIVGNFLTAKIAPSNPIANKFIFRVTALECTISSHGVIGNTDAGVTYFAGCTVSNKSMQNLEGLANSLEKVASSNRATFYTGALGKKIGQADKVACLFDADPNLTNIDEMYQCSIDFVD